MPRTSCRRWVGQALAARTYAELAALTADLPRAEWHRLCPRHPHRHPPSRGPGTGRRHGRSRRAWAPTTALILAIGVAVTRRATGDLVVAAVAAVAIVIFSAVVTAFVASLIAVTVKLTSVS